MGRLPDVVRYNSHEPQTPSSVVRNEKSWTPATFVGYTFSILATRTRMVMYIWIYSLLKAHPPGHNVHLNAQQNYTQFPKLQISFAHSRRSSLSACYGNYGHLGNWPSSEKPFFLQGFKRGNQGLPVQVFLTGNFCFKLNSAPLVKVNGISWRPVP